MLIDYLRRVAENNPLIVLIELFLIGLVVYWVVDFLEGTRGERLFRSVIFILIAGFLILNLLVKRFDFARLQYLYNGFLVFVLIIAVAAFQPEIRRALIRIGQPRFLGGLPHQLVRSIEQIIIAVTDLSETKTGAIIVVEQKVALGEFIETGVKLDAIVSSQLLKTIFKPGTALHDMAVVIRGDRIVAANVQLPLAEAGSIDGFQLGSRHRAAIGITSGSDAICIVVSEETGTISIAKAGSLIRRLNQSELREYLTKQMAEKQATLKKVKKGGTEDQFNESL
jgi:diadenylate cyclase